MSGRIVQFKAYVYFSVWAFCFVHFFLIRQCTSDMKIMKQ